MKMRNHSKILRYLGVPLLAAALFCSCTDELSSETRPGGGNAGGEQKVTLQLQVPGSSEGKKAATRAVGSNPTEVLQSESTVNDLYIMAFDEQGGFDYYTKARKTTADGKWDAMLLAREHKQTFVFAANVDGTEGKDTPRLSELIATLEKGTAKADALKKLEVSLTDHEVTNGFNAADAANHRPFTMYGQTTVDLATLQNKEMTVYLHRIMGRIQIHFGVKNGEKYPGLNNFNPQSVHLYNTNTRARVFPDNLQDPDLDDNDPGKNDYKYVTTPSIPAGLTPNKGPIKYTIPDNGTNELIGQIYLFETEQPNTGYVPDNADVHEGRTCVVIGGEYNGKTQYYRVDLAKPGNGNDTTSEDPGQNTYYHVLRNHSYEITVTGITGDGYGTPEDAFKGSSGNIKTHVVAWNDGKIGNIDFIGDQFLGLGTMKYELSRLQSTITQEVTASQGLKWKAELLGAKEDADGKTVADEANTPDWITFVESGKTTLPERTGTGNTVDCQLNVQATDSERKAFMRFSADNLRLDALVMQTTEDEVFVRVVKTKTPDTEVKELTFDETGKAEDDLTITFGGTANTKLYWELRYDGGLPLSGTIDGTNFGSTNESGEITIENGKTQKEITWHGLSEQFPGAWGTRTAYLTVQAEAEGKRAAKTIQLTQKKYGLDIDNDVVICLTDDGTTAQTRPHVIGVKTNIEDWTCTSRGTNYDNLVGTYIQAIGTQNGGKADYYGTQSVSVTTLGRPFEIESKTFELVFRDTKTREEYSKSITVKTAWNYNGKMYELLAGQMLSHTDKTLGNFPSAAHGYKVVTYEQAIALNKLTAVSPKIAICATSEAYDRLVDDGTGEETDIYGGWSEGITWIATAAAGQYNGNQETVCIRGYVDNCPVRQGTNIYYETEKARMRLVSKDFQVTKVLNVNMRIDATERSTYLRIYENDVDAVAGFAAYGKWYAMEAGMDKYNWYFESYYSPRFTFGNAAGYQAYMDDGRRIDLNYELGPPRFGLEWTAGVNPTKANVSFTCRWNIWDALKTLTYKNTDGGGQVLYRPLVDKKLPTYFVKEVK